MCSEYLSRRKQVTEEDRKEQTPFQKDIDRVVYSDAFQGLKHKTQAFYMPADSHVSNRMDHSMTVAENSSAVAKKLGLNEDLARAIGLAHDIGHAPLGYDGETIFNEIVQENNVLRSTMQSFRNETNTLRVLDSIATTENYNKAGLNVTLGVRDGVVHLERNGNPTTFTPHRIQNEEDCCKLEDKLESILQTWPKQVDSPSSCEGCVVRLVDSIVHTGVDVRDAAVSSLLDEESKNKYEEFFQAEGAEFCDDCYSVSDFNTTKYFSYFLQDLVANSHPARGIGLSKEAASKLQRLQNLNKTELYNHPRTNAYKEVTKLRVKKLYSRLLDDVKRSYRLTYEDQLAKTELVYPAFKDFIVRKGYSFGTSDEQIVLDYLTGLTDTYLQQCVHEVCDT